MTTAHVAPTLLLCKNERIFPQKQSHTADVRNWKQDRQCTYAVTLRHVREIIVM
jgi:hypothetical protein